MPSIQATFNSMNDCPSRDFFREPSRSTESLHMALFQSRKNINLEPIKRLVMDLPNGCFLHGGFMASLVANQVPNNYDIFFTDEWSMQALVRRIQSAPEDSFLHGYTSETSLLEFSPKTAGIAMVFTHPTKPPLKLNRVRWFDTASDLIDKDDFTICQFVITRDLNVTFTTDSIRDVVTKVVRINRLNFHKSSALRMKKLMDAGYTYQNGSNYGSGYRDELLTIASRAIASDPNAINNAGMYLR